MANASSNPDTKPLINLLRGWPAPSLLPADLIKTAANAVLSDPAVAIDGLLYGPDPGYEPLRETIASWLGSFYQPEKAITAERICITGGASQNLGCMLSVYTDPEYTKNIWIVAPAYFLAFRIFEDAGFAGKMRAVPEDDAGIDIEFLRRELHKSEEQARDRGLDRPRFKSERKYRKLFKHVIYCVPTFANPSSRTMSLDRRKKLVQLAREFDALVVCDDVYDLLLWPADCKQETLVAMKTAHLPRCVDLDRVLDGGAKRKGADGFGNACSNGSFTKIAGPGMRAGWVEGTTKFAYGVSQTGTTCSGGAPSQLTSTYINHLLTTGALQSHIQDTLRPAYASRYASLMNAVQEHLVPLGFRLPQSDRDVVGGYFTWLLLPEGLKAEQLGQRCMKENVVIATGKIFEVPGDEKVKFEKHVRLCWAWEDEWKLEEGVKRIGEVAKRVLAESEQEEGDAEFVVVDGQSTGEVDDFK